MRSLLLALAVVVGTWTQTSLEEKPRPSPTPDIGFVFPCDGYLKGLEKEGNFGLFVADKKSPFRDSWHLAEDVWLQGGTTVRAIADGIVRYSDFSPTWTDKKGFVHWNLGNVIVIEHELPRPIEEMKAVCSFYVHLAADRRVAVGDRVVRGQVIGRIGADKSVENGKYPAHLHFGIHRGPYIQIASSFEREVRRTAASKDGLRVGDTVLKGEVTLRRVGESAVLITSVETKADVVYSLLVGSTAPDPKPTDIMNWCQGYGPKDVLDEWLQPSRFIAAHPPR